MTAGHVFTPRRWRRALFAATMSCLGTTSALAIDQPLAGPALPHIPNVHTIHDWQLIDDHHVILDLSPERHYLLKFNRSCPALRYAEAVSISVSNNTIWAGFDHVTADGLRCAIKTIQQLPSPARETPNA